MKKLGMLLFVFAISIILLPGQSSAQFQYDNQVGLYTTDDGLGATGTSVMGAAVSVYLVLTRPADELNGNVPYYQCLGFECTLRFSTIPAGSLFLLEENLPPFSIDIGLRKDIDQGYLDYVCGISDGAGLPVVDSAVSFLELVFFNTYPGMIEVYLEPVAPNQSIDGQMAYLGNDNNDDLRVMYSKGGSFENPVFIFNGMAVPVETESFGSVKALYR